jgi:hypothetical protein
MPIRRALPGTLGVLALVLLPAAVALLNLGAGLANLEPRHVDRADRADRANRAQTVLVGRYVASPSGADDRIDLSFVSVY